MMEDAYNALLTEGHSQNEAVGKVITEFGNLDELAPVLGISAEINPKVSGESSNKEASKYPTVTLEEAQGFAESRRSTQFSLSLAVALFVLSPVSLFVALLLAGQDNQATALGLIPLLALIAIGVIIVVGVDQRRASYKHISVYQFSSNPVVSTWAKELDRQHESRRILSLQIAVSLWILSAAPIILMSLAFPDFGGERMGAVFGVILTLVFVAAGLMIFLPANWANEVAAVLTKHGGVITDYKYSSEGNSVIGIIAAFYWPLMVAIYLSWSFISGDWNITWLVWPIGIAIFVVFAAGFGAIERYRAGKR